MTLYKSFSLDRRRFLMASAGTTALAGLGGCYTTNPATGGKSFTGGMDTAKEVSMGREMHPNIIKEFGGTYGNSNIQGYVSEIGQALVRNVERKDLQYTFTVLNSDIINAFATPGGFIYITRGLLTLADNEAEMAGVLGHELGHVNALHIAQRYGQSQVVGLGTGLLALGTALLTGDGRAAQGVMELGQTVGGMTLAGFSREAEFEADSLGVRYLARTGFDPRGMSSFLAKLNNDSRLQATIAGKDPSIVDQTHYLSTHPRTADRVVKAANQAKSSMNKSQPRVARDRYLSAIDGILYGDDPQEGIIRGQTFMHPGLRFKFTVPKGFRLINGADQVQAVHKNGSAIIFDIASLPRGGNAKSYLTSVWGKKAQLSNVEPIRLNNGLTGATGITRGKANGRAMDIRMVAIVKGKQVNRFMFVSPPNLTGGMTKDFQQTAFSFDNLTRNEIGNIRPYRLDIVTVQTGDTAESLAARMPFSQYKIDRWEVLNGRSRKTPLKPGEKVKIIKS